MEKKHSMEEILHALKVVEEYHHARWRGKDNNPHLGVVTDLFNGILRRLPKVLEPENYGTLERDPGRMRI